MSRIAGITREVAVRRVHFLNVSAEEEDERGELFG
jgi:hypothetical protein